MFGPAQRQSNRPVHFPAPVAGYDTVNPGAELPELKSVYCFNLIGAEQGLRSRLGYQEWIGPATVGGAAVLAGAADNIVRTMVPFVGSSKNGTKNKLFAVTSTGIYDVTSSGTAASLVFTFATQTGDAGYGVDHAMVTAAGYFLDYVDEVNGLIRYTESTNTWAAVTMGGGAGQISGVDPANFRFVNVFKNRLWYVEKDSHKAWYLDAGAISGAATQFAFTTSGFPRHGGPIVGLWNWTYDGGAGMDDLLVAISQGGDILIYGGTDPSSASAFGLKGVWYVGGIPAGRRIATDLGGDLLIMCATGIVPLSKLLAGAATQEQSIYATRDIANDFNQLVGAYKSIKGWGLYIHPTDNALLVTYPTQTDYQTSQLAMSFATQGWSKYRDLPIYSACVWDGELYFGTTDGRVCKNTGYVDNVTKADGSYSPVKWSMLTGFRAMSGAGFKRGVWTDTYVLSQTPTPTVEATLRYEFDPTEPANPALTGALPGGTWDGSVWDTTLWGGDYVASRLRRGAVGRGRYVAVAVRGQAICRTVLVGVDVFLRSGGAR